jgi:hypothetical protein
MHYSKLAKFYYCKKVGVTEGAVEIWINIHLAREIPWWHDTCEPHRHHEWQPFVMTIEELGCVLSHRSAYLPRDTWTSIRGWPTPYPSVYLLSDVRYHSSWQLSKLLSLQDPIISYASIHNQSCSLGPDDQSSIDTDGATTFRALNMKTDHSQPFHPVFSTFP